MSPKRHFPIWLPTLQFKTIGEAAVRTESGDVVVLHNGTYREKVTVNRSGTRDKPIRSEAMSGARVISKSRH